MNKLPLCAAIIEIKLISLDFDTKSTDELIIYVNALCININNKKIIVCNYIPGIISARFFSHKELSELYDDSEIDWSNAHNLIINSMSKQWDFTKFNMINEEQITNLINFPKINKIMETFSLDYQYEFFGSSNDEITPIAGKKMNLIHDKLTKQLWHLIEPIESCCGSIIYRIYKDENNRTRYKISGYTSSNYDGYTRVVPLEYLLNNDIFIDVEYSEHQFTIDEIFDSPIIRNTIYPKLKNDYGKLKKNDIIVVIDGNHIFNCNIRDNTINEYLTYQKGIIRFVLIRDSDILNIDIDIIELSYKFLNKIYMNVSSIPEHFSELEFNTDIGDLLLENEIYNQDMAKYLYNPSHPISNIII